MVLVLLCYRDPATRAGATRGLPFSTKGRELRERGTTYWDVLANASGLTAEGAENLREQIKDFRDNLRRASQT